MPKLLRDLKSFYATNRRDLPWRRTRDPYKILVSEVMLQQTQVERVIPKYEAFIKLFPTPSALAKAPLSKVLAAWSGLGYNRRAKYLQASAKIIGEMEESSDKSPRNPRFAKGKAAARLLFYESSVKLPGVGPYTMQAVAAFAYNKPTLFIETNIRTVFLYHCFQSRKHLDSLVTDKEILPLVEEALKKSRMEPRDFYAALMDYGTYLKRSGVRLNKKSKHYNKQSKFEGSYRQLRGAIIKALLEKSQTMDTLIDLTGRAHTDVARIVANLSSEGLVDIKNKKISIAK
jgi:A/G-specific adenine glycosylase